MVTSIRLLWGAAASLLSLIQAILGCRLWGGRERKEERNKLVNDISSPCSNMKHGVTFQTSTMIFVVLSNFFFVPVNGFVSSFRMNIRSFQLAAQSFLWFYFVYVKSMLLPFFVPRTRFTVARTGVTQAVRRFADWRSRWSF